MCRTCSPNFINTHHQKTEKNQNQKSADIALFNVVLIIVIRTKISAEIALFKDLK